MKDPVRSQELASFFQVSLQWVCWLLIVVVLGEQHHWVLLFLQQCNWLHTNQNQSRSYIFHLENLGVGWEDSIPSSLNIISTSLFGLLTLHILQGLWVQEMKIRQEVRSPMLIMANGVIIVTILWTSTSSSVMGFNGEQTRHVSCPESRTLGSGGERME